MTTKKPKPDRPICPVCHTGLHAKLPSGKNPQFRCYKCNINLIITNRSYLPQDLWKFYWRLVLNKVLGIQDRFWKKQDDSISCRYGNDWY